MNSKVDKLVEWVAKRAYELNNPFHPWHKAGKASKGWYRTLARGILSHPDLYLQITGETPILTLNLGKGDESYCAVSYISIAEVMKEG